MAPAAVMTPIMHSTSTTTDTALAQTDVAQARVESPWVPDGALQRGAVVGRYVVLSKLGAGGMGVVFAAYDPELDRKIALKLLHPRLAASCSPITNEPRTRLLREAQALAKLAHPNIVAIYDVGEHEGTVWLAMELVDGETLTDWLSRRRSWRDVVEVVIAAAHGLAAAHASGLIHRDVKPDNIMIGRDGRVRVMDLGLARAQIKRDAPLPSEISADALTAVGPELQALAAQVTRDGSLVGTPAYMSPEQLRGEPVDARSDVFSLCVTLWEALMGGRPFVGKNLLELASNILSGEIRDDPSDPNVRRVPRWLRRICRRGLEVNPALRWPSMTALLRELEIAPRRRRRMLGISIFGALILGSTVGFILHRNHVESVCEALGAEIEQTWSEHQKSALEVAMKTAKRPYADVTFERTAFWLDRYVRRLATTTVEACRDERMEGRIDAETWTEISACLSDHRINLEALVENISAGGEFEMKDTITAAAALPAVEVCSDPIWRSRWLAATGSESSVDLRHRLLIASAQHEAGRDAEASESIDALIADASGDPALHASALLLAGKIYYTKGDDARADQFLQGAFVAAGRIGLDGVAAQAAIELARPRKPNDRRLLWCAVSDALLPRSEARPGPLALARADVCAELLQDLGKHAEARLLAMTTVDDAADSVGNVHPTLLGALMTQAAAEASLRLYPAALATMERIELITTEMYGERHPRMVRVLGMRGRVLLEAGQMEAAITAFRRAVSVQEEAFGAEHIDTALAMMNVGIMRRMVGDFDGAQEDLKEALRRAEKALPPEDEQLLRFIRNLAQIQVEANAHEEARQTFGRALALTRRLYPADHPESLRLQAKLGWAALERGDLEEAELHLRQALPVMETVIGATHHDTIFALFHLGDLLHVQGRDDEAERYLQRALVGMDSGRLEADQAVVKGLLAEILWSRPGENERALALAREALSSLQNAGPDFASRADRVNAWLAAHQ